MSDQVGLDTSFILRLLVGEPKAQAERALQFVRQSFLKGRPAIVSDLVIAEAYFALHAHYGVPKITALKTLLDFLEGGFVHLEENGSARKALENCLSASKKLGFLDRLIHTQYHSAKIGMATFEKAASRLDQTIVL